MRDRLIHALGRFLSDEWTDEEIRLPTKRGAAGAHAAAQMAVRNRTGQMTTFKVGDRVRYKDWRAGAWAYVIPRPKDWKLEPLPNEVVVDRDSDAPRACRCRAEDLELLPDPPKTTTFEPGDSVRFINRPGKWANVIEWPETSSQPDNKVALDRDCYGVMRECWVHSFEIELLPPDPPKSGTEVKAARAALPWTDEERDELRRVVLQQVFNKIRTLQIEALQRRTITPPPPTAPKQRACVPYSAEELRALRKTVHEPCSVATFEPAYKN